jgi:hypothetical protein
MRRSTLNFLGVAVLAFGLGSVMLIERNIRFDEAHRLEDTESTHALLHPEDYGAYERNAEQISGKIGLLFDRWGQSVANLGHSRSFALIQAALSLVGAAALFLSPDRSSPPPPD